MTEEEQEDMSKYRAYFKTIQSTCIKSMFEGLNGIVSNINIHFSPEGIQIIEISRDVTSMTHTKLLADRFEMFHCLAPTRAAVNIDSIGLILKSVVNGDVISMYLKQGDSSKLHIVVENSSKNMRDVSSINLIDINEVIYEIPDIEFDSVICMSSTEFQRICKDLLHISNEVTMSRDGDRFSMEVKGDVGTKRVVLGEGPDNSVRFNKMTSVSKTMSNTFDLKIIARFNKNASLCSVVEIFMKQDNPFVIIFKVASLGSLKFALAPKITV